MSEQITAGHDQKPGTPTEQVPWKPPEVGCKLWLWGLLVTFGAIGVVTLGLFLDDYTVKTTLGFGTRGQLIAAVAKYVALFAAGFWAAAQLILLHQREAALAVLHDYDIKLRKAQADIKETEAKTFALHLQTKYSEQQGLASLQKTQAEILKLELDSVTAQPPSPPKTLCRSRG